ncbi:hypothetical protein ACJQ40_000735 [Enterococcus faecium]|uniref:hypothetical protein n=1 Tax=Enterococcus TaxID=1350 RepID=UPI000FFE409E|nr:MULTISPECIES: hypothetical protein [Enterococcus]MDT2093756.1 hypothetical protein [Enterococcus faecalis]MDW3615526.1 hypothetical protein [Enterococcus faecium]RXF15519.1 hypothetical protein EG877_03940 [Enterococcus faecalis]TKN74382.1 hypothetical protein DVX21_01765 [Enterococcus faecium]TKQ45814.1 hypothetical protein DV463_00555 [Enterococcus faecium]
MTNGTSQGLFVVVTIVIFSIFVLISFILFNDNMKPILSSFFTDSVRLVDLSGTITGKTGNKYLIENQYSSLKYNFDNSFTIKSKGQPLNERYLIGMSMNYKPLFKPNETIKVTMEVFSNKDTSFYIDFNAKKSDWLESEGNDYYDIEKAGNNSIRTYPIKGNQWNTITYDLYNNKHYTLAEGSSFGILSKNFKDTPDFSYTIRNITYEIIK